MDHTFKPHDPECDDAERTCYKCHLSCCDVCHGVEGSLPTDCPGIPISQEYQQLIYKSILDYREDLWVRRPYEKWEKSDAAAEIIVDIIAKKLNEARHEPE